jgi:uridylate kinase
MPLKRYKMTECKYHRVLLKLSGESFCKAGQYGIDGDSLGSIAERIAEICKLGPQVAIVVGAGNFLRGENFSQTSHIPRNTADYMGMLATIINACALQETLEKLGRETRVLSAIEVPALCEGLFAEGPSGISNEKELRYWREEREILFLPPTHVRR